MVPLVALEAPEVEPVVASHAGQEEYEIPVHVQQVVPLVALEAPEVELVVALHPGQEE